LKTHFGVNAGMDHSPLRIAKGGKMDEEKMKGPITKSSFTQMRVLNNRVIDPDAFQ
jgi:hypothetical protein